MLEKNPYETEKPVDVPSFMSKKDDDSIDMSKIILSNDELDDDDYYDDDGNRFRLKLKKEYILPLIIGAVSLVIIIVLLISLISINSKYKTLQAEFESENEMKDAKILRYEAEIANDKKSIESLQTQVSNAQKEIESLKEKLNNEGKIDSGETGEKDTTDLKAGTYYASDIGNNIRTGTGTEYDMPDYDDLPVNIKEIVDGYSSVIKANETFTVLEVVSEEDGSVWGRIGTDLWVMLRNADGYDYVSY